jgi:hypothetical protein
MTVVLNTILYLFSLNVAAAKIEDEYPIKNYLELWKKKQDTSVNNLGSYYKER